MSNVVKMPRREYEAYVRLVYAYDGNYLRLEEAETTGDFNDDPKQLTYVCMEYAYMRATTHGTSGMNRQYQDQPNKLTRMIGIFEDESGYFLTHHCQDINHEDITSGKQALWLLESDGLLTLKFWKRVTWLILKTELNRLWSSLKNMLRLKNRSSSS